VEPLVPTIVLERQTELRDWLLSVLNQSPYQVVGIASDMAEFFALKIAVSPPVLIIVGADDGWERATERIAQIRALRPKVKIIAVAESPGSFDLERCLKSSADGCVFSVESRQVFQKCLDLALQEKIIVVGRGKGIRL
jgi:DNA-binding NarL/FixJ family response regulator